MIDKQKQFEKLYLSGKFTQKDIAQELNVTEQTIVRWVRKLEPLKCVQIKKNLIQHLDVLAQESDYKANAPIISRLIADIDKIDNWLSSRTYL